jgi:ribosomal-protein-alanine N-acetyltransferase
MPTPALYSERLALFHYTWGDVTDRHVEWLNDPEVVRYSEQRHMLHTTSTQSDYLFNFKNHHANDHIWRISLNEADIGTITAYVDDINKVANMGILVGDKSVWGKGYGTEAWSAVMNWLFAKRDIRKVEAGFALPNTGMRRICNKSGMKYEGSRPDHFLIDGKPEYLDLYGKFK